MVLRRVACRARDPAGKRRGLTERTELCQSRDEYVLGDVIGVVRDPSVVQPSDARVRLVQGDATNADSVALVVRGSDAVVSAISPRPNAISECDNW